MGASLAASTGVGLVSPGAARAMGRPSQLDVDNASIVAEAGQAPNPNQTIETSNDPYRRMTAPVTLNGQGPFFFVVDTGANQSVISHELAQMLALPEGPPIDLHGVADVERVSTVVVQKVQVGERIERDVVMPSLTQADIGAPGIIGIDRLKNQTVKLDFHSHRLSVEGSRFEDLPPFTSRVRARQRSGQLTIVDADLAGIPVSAFLDSGAERTIGNPALLDLAVQRNPKAAFYDVPVISVTGKTLQGQIALLPVLRLGHVRLVDISVTFADLHVFQIWGLTQPSILLGMDALSTFDSVTMDFGHAEVWFELYPGRRKRS
jgi:predicted aspartyl protease